MELPSGTDDTVDLCRLLQSMEGTLFGKEHLRCRSMGSNEEVETTAADNSS